MNIGMFLCTYECMFKGMYDHPYVRMYVCMYKTAIVQSMRFREYFEEKLFKFVLKLFHVDYLAKTQNLFVGYRRLTCRTAIKTRRQC